MKRASLSYHRDFPWTPISGWAGARWSVWLLRQSGPGRRIRIVREHSRFLRQRALWCLLTLDFDDVQLRFATPQELDDMLDILSRQPRPSAGSLVSWQRLGRPNNHWLSRLPKQAKTRKFHAALCKFVARDKTVQSFRDFYKDRAVAYDLQRPDEFDSYPDARKARLAYVAAKRDLPQS